MKEGREPKYPKKQNKLQAPEYALYYSLKFKPWHRTVLRILYNTALNLMHWQVHCGSEAAYSSVLQEQGVQVDRHANVWNIFLISLIAWKYYADSVKQGFKPE